MASHQERVRRNYPDGHLGAVEPDRNATDKELRESAERLLSRHCEALHQLAYADSRVAMGVIHRFEDDVRTLLDFFESTDDITPMQAREIADAVKRLRRAMQ